MATATTTDTRTRDDGSWIHGCFMVQVGTDFNTYKEIVTYAGQDERFGKVGAPALDAATKKVLDSGVDSGSSSSGALPVYFSKRKCRDSSLGGNDAINPLPQFCADDDIAYGHFVSETDSTVAMGQVYSETYDDLQQILYLGFGIPNFSNVGSFWTSATDMDLANFINKGSGITAEKIGYLIGSAPSRIFNVVTIPSKYLDAVTNSLQNVKISQYYSFSSQMPMYFRFVNTILIMLATNMNMAGSSTAAPTTGSVTSGTTAVAQVTGGTTKAEDQAGISFAFRDHGLDMARIMVKRFKYEMGNQAMQSKRYTDEALFKAAAINNGDGVATDTDPNQSTNTTAPTEESTGLKAMAMNYFDNFMAAYQDGIYDGHLFVGFRIDKGMGGSESFSNATGESQISQTANERFQAARETSFQTMQNSYGDGIIGSTVGAVTGAVGGFMSGVSNMMSMDPLAGVATGAARINVPDVWMSSAWSRTASFTITCMAPYGDYESILQSEYVPLACILAGALPRGTGASSHSAPFVCQAYCRGVFSSPLCIIESLEIVRGADQFGMNAARLPLKLTMHVTLKDLSPVMYMTMGGDRGITNAVVGTDDAFGEYLLTLSGMGLRDRLNPYRAIRRKLQIYFSTLTTNNVFLNPYMMGMEGADRFRVSRLMSRIAGVSGRGLSGT